MSAGEPLGGDEDGGLVPPGHEDTDLSLEELLELSRGIQLETLPGASTRLSRFTLKQISRANKIADGKRRSGKKLKKINNPKKAWQTQRKRKRTNQRKAYDTPKRRWWEKNRRYGAEWGISIEEWGDIWEMVGTPRFRIGRYDSEKPWTKYNLYVESNSGEKLYEGTEEYLRDKGYIY